MSQTPSISIIIPIYKVAAFIEKCAHSLLGQTFDDIEYIFVDDSSPDNSMKLLDGVVAQYPNRAERIKIINHSSNKGLSAARNTGLLAAQGRYILHCDSDDWVEADMCQKMYELATQTDADMVCCGGYLDRDGSSERLEYPDGYRDDVHNIETVRIGSIYSCVWNKLTKKELYDRHDIAPYDDISMWEDNAVTFRLRFFSKKTVIINECFYHYVRINSNSICRSSNVLKKLNDTVICAQRLCSFLYDNRASCRDFEVVSAYIEFESKTELLSPDVISMSNIRLWESIFPQSSRFINRLPVRQYDKLIGRLIINRCKYLALLVALIQKNRLK